MKLFVEGGGDGRSLKNACREGFARFLKKAGFAGRMPRIVACGARRQAYSDYCTALNAGECAMLLVDSEELVMHSSAWQHLKQREGDKWEVPPRATDDDCHLMVVCMESWLIADRQALKDFFGKGFKENALPAKVRPVESLNKKELMEALEEATGDCASKGKYSKGNHSFELLGLIEPETILIEGSFAKRFIDTLQNRMGG